jgi:hypothetical protein
MLTWYHAAIDSRADASQLHIKLATRRLAILFCCYTAQSHVQWGYRILNVSAKKPLGNRHRLLPCSTTECVSYFWCAAWPMWQTLSGFMIEDKKCCLYLEVTVSIPPQRLQWDGMELSMGRKMTVSP